MRVEGTKELKKWIWREGVEGLGNDIYGKQQFNLTFPLIFYIHQLHNSCFVLIPTSTFMRATNILPSPYTTMLLWTSLICNPTLFSILISGLVILSFPNGIRVTFWSANPTPNSLSKVATERILASYKEIYWATIASTTSSLLSFYTRTIKRTKLIQEQLGFSSSNPSLNSFLC